MRGVVLIFVLMLLAAAYRAAIVIPQLNYYKPGMKWNTTTGTRFIYQPLNATLFPPGYAFKGGGAWWSAYPPSLSFVTSFIADYAETPWEIEGFLDIPAVRPSEFNYYGANGRRQPTPPIAEKPFFVIRVTPESAYVRDVNNQIVAECGENAAFYRLTDDTWSTVIPQDANAKKAPGQTLDIYCSPVFYEWSELSKNSGKMKSSRALYSSSVSDDSLWSDPHTRFYTASGHPMKTPVFTKGGYRITAHLTLLYSKRTGRLAGGYWWGEFTQDPVAQAEYNEWY